MLRNRRNGSQTRSALLRAELNESVEHARRAAGHAAIGMRAAGAHMAPTAGRARRAAVQRWGATVAAFNEPTGRSARHAVKAKKRAKQARREAEKAIRAKRSRASRAPRLVAMLAVGAALGGAWALAQRRRRQQWDEFVPGPARDEAARASDEMVGADPVQGAVGEGPEPSESSRARQGERPTPG
jgi:hypothetical protein